MRIQASDNSNPVKLTEITVIISVYRDTSRPVFDIPNYLTTINENTAVGTSIQNVRATDADLVVGILPLHAYISFVLLIYTIILNIYKLSNAETIMQKATREQWCSGYVWLAEQGARG